MLKENVFRLTTGFSVATKVIDQEPLAGDTPEGRKLRADAQRNLETLLRAAKEVFAEAGLDAPVRDIASRAGVGIGTVYRHFPQRADLIAAVFWQEIERCAAAADKLAAEHAPFDALRLWMHEFVDLASTKRGLAQALHSGDPAFDSLPTRREQQLQPAFRKLFDAALASGDIQSDISADDFLNAAATLCMSAGNNPDQALGMVMLLTDGLRYRAGK
ncbi:MAG: TetR/AcrR family transcriptional regulator [Hyphomicrobiales bacterium]|nr:TetR/AcrR family transcriptional regulator [Hyphomicrobiales bacterium]MDE2114272.1 helix-turn-helix transcriptional regulator [Hyphomicrobiales bacterium]